MTETNGPESLMSTLGIAGAVIENSEPQRRSWRGILGRVAVAVVLFAALYGQFASSLGPTESRPSSGAAPTIALPGRAVPAPTTVPAPTSCWSSHDITGSLDPPACSCTRA